jgi:hypothetical protein
MKNYNMRSFDEITREMDAATKANADIEDYASNETYSN